MNINADPHKHKSNRIQHYKSGPIADRTNKTSVAYITERETS